MRKRIVRAQTEYRTRTSFLLFAKTLPIGSRYGIREKRWLERTSWQQEFYPWLSRPGGFWHDEYWTD